MVFRKMLMETPEVFKTNKTSLKHKFSLKAFRKQTKRFKKQKQKQNKTKLYNGIDVLSSLTLSYLSET